MTLLGTKVLPAVLFVALGAATAPHAQERMRAGMWDNTVTAGGQTMTRSSCLSARNAAMSNGSPAVIRAAIEKALPGSCKLTEFKIDNNSKSETMVCAGKTMRNETTFHGGDSVDTTVTQTVGGVAKVSRFKGRRTGDCKAGDQ